MENYPKFNLEFVNIVKEYGELYNNTLLTYNHKNKQNQAWEEIAKRVNGNAKECKMRWRTLRTALLNYIRERDDTSKRSSGKVTKPYYLNEAMRFVLPFIKQRGNQMWRNSHKNREEIASSCGTFDEITSTSVVIKNKIPEDIQNDTDVLKCTQLDEPILESSEYEANNSINNSQWASNNDDADFEFFKSLIPDLRNMTSKQKRKFKQKVLQAIDDILDADNTQNLMSF